LTRKLHPYLGSEELGGRVDIGVVGGDMDVPVDVIFGNSLDDSLGSFDVDILEGEVSNAVSQAVIS
jgi:hypothetical protein